MLVHGQIKARAKQTAIPIVAQLCLTRTCAVRKISLMRLQAYLDHSGITASAFARRIGRSHSTVLRWADGVMAPTLGAMQDMYVATNGLVQPNDFLSGDILAVQSIEGLVGLEPSTQAV